jgi:catechol 2,3-dioxygenase-like lactoylglutathione lyase family enzyme
MFDKSESQLGGRPAGNREENGMSRAFGPIFQVAYVVEDVEAHIDHWTRVMGVGPFFRFPLPLPFAWLEVRGERVPVDAPIYESVAIAYSGETMIELIQPGPAPSTYREFLDAGRKGVHHLGTFTDDYDNQMAAARAAGIGVALEGALPLSRFAYLDTDILFPGTMVEIIEPRPSMIELFDGIRAACRDWDGRERIRAM